MTKICLFCHDLCVFLYLTIEELTIIVVQTFRVFSSNFAYILQCGGQNTAILPQMSPKVFCRSPMTKISKLCIFLGLKMPKTEKNCLSVLDFI